MGRAPSDQTVIFVDLAGFTALTEAHGDEEAAALAGRFEDLARAGLGEGDRLVKTIGDAVMLASPTPEGGLALVGRLLDSCLREPGFPVARAGLHAGPVVERGDDLFGTTVNLAARVTGQAFGGQVLGTTPVADAARRQGLAVVELGSFSLRNVSQEVELFEVVLSRPPGSVGIDPVCRMQVERSAAAGRLRHEDRDYWFCSLGCAAAFAADPARYTTAAP